MNEKILEHKVKTFFNNLTQEEAIAFRRLTTTKKWQEYINARIYNQKIEL